MKKMIKIPIGPPISPLSMDAEGNLFARTLSELIMIKDATVQVVDTPESFHYLFRPPYKRSHIHTPVLFPNQVIYGSQGTDAASIRCIHPDGAVQWEHAIPQAFGFDLLPASDGCFAHYLDKADDKHHIAKISLSGALEWTLPFSGGLHLLSTVSDGSIVIANVDKDLEMVQIFGNGQRHLLKTIPDFGDYEFCADARGHFYTISGTIGPTVTIETYGSPPGCAPCLMNKIDYPFDGRGLCSWNVAPSGDFFVVRRSGYTPSDGFEYVSKKGERTAKLSLHNEDSTLNYDSESHHITILEDGKCITLWSFNLLAESSKRTYGMILYDGKKHLIINTSKPVVDVVPVDDGILYLERIGQRGFQLRHLPMPIMT